MTFSQGQVGLENIFLFFPVSFVFHETPEVTFTIELLSRVEVVAELVVLHEAVELLRWAF